MKNPTKILIGVIVVVLIGAGIYFGNTKLQKGSFSKSQFKSSLPDLTIYDISTASLTSDFLTDDKINWLVTTQNKGACFKDSKDGKEVKVQLWGMDVDGKLTKAKPTASDFNDYFGYLWQDSICGKGWVSFTFDNPDPFVSVYATIDSAIDSSKNSEILESNENNNSRSEKGHMKWVEE